MTDAETVAARIKAGSPTQQALTRMHSRKTATQSNGMPAVYVFQDNSKLIILGRGIGRDIKTA